MSQKKNENKITPDSKPDCTLKGIKKIACKLDQDRKIYPLYGFFDGLNLSYSTLKYFFDMVFTNSSLNASDMMHDWLLSPIGIPIAVIGTLNLVALSAYSGAYQEDGACDLLQLDTPPKKNELAQLHLSEKTQQAYIWVDGDLYFVHKRRGVVKKITCKPQDKAHFLNYFQPSKTPVSLTKNQIILMQGIAHYNHLNAFPDYAAWIWPYVRDICKAIKNGQKGMRSLLYLISKLSAHSFKYLNLPLAIAASILAALLRLWWRRMVENRKARQDFNNALSDEFLDKCNLIAIPDDTNELTFDLIKNQMKARDLVILKGTKLYFVNYDKQSVHLIEKTDKNTTFYEMIVAACTNQLTAANAVYLEQINQLTNRTTLLDKKLEAFLGVLEQDQLQQWTKDYNALLNQIQKQPGFSKVSAYAAVTLGALIDATYLYVGLLTLAAFAWPVFIAMSVFCIVFSAIQILVRIYEEYCFQEKLQISVLECEISILETQMTSLIGALKQNDKQTDGLNLILDQAYRRYQASITKLNHIYVKRNGSAILEGFKSGLAAFGAVASGFFGISTFMALAGAVFPPLLIMGVVAAGMAALIGFTCFTLYKYYQHRKTQTPVKLAQADIIVSYLKQTQQQPVPEIDEVKLLFKTSKRLPAPPVYFQEIFELIRSFFSGISKGLKSIDYTLNPAAMQGGDGHYYETPVMIILGAIAAFFYALIFALCSLSKRFSRLALPVENTSGIAAVVDLGNQQPNSQQAHDIQKNPPKPHSNEVVPENHSNFFLKEAALKSAPSSDSMKDDLKYARKTFGCSGDNEIKKKSRTNLPLKFSQDVHQKKTYQKNLRFFNASRRYAQDDINVLNSESLAYRKQYNQVDPIALQKQQQNETLRATKCKMKQHDEKDDASVLAHVYAIL